MAGNLLVDEYFLVIDKIPGSLTGSQVFLLYDYNQPDLSGESFSP